MARIFIAATTDDIADLKRILNQTHEFVTSCTMAEAHSKLKGQAFKLIMIGVHFDQSRMFDLLRELRKTPESAETAIVCFCMQNTPLMRKLHESIEVASKVLGACIYLDVYKPDGPQDAEAELRRMVERCLTGEMRREIQADRRDLHTERENILRLRLALANKEWSVGLEDRVADLREKLAEVLLELSELQIASVAQKEIVAASEQMEDRVSLQMRSAESVLEVEETRIGLQESKQLGKEQEIVPGEEQKAKEGRRRLADDGTVFSLEAPEANLQTIVQAHLEQSSCEQEQSCPQEASEL